MSEQGNDQQSAEQQQQTSDQQSRSRGSSSSSQQSAQQQPSSPLRTERGNTTIQSTVVSRVAGIAAQEVEGIRMGGGGSQAVSGLVGSITGGQGGAQTAGVAVEVGAEEAAVDLTLSMEYGRSIPQISEAVRRNVVERVESLVGLRVNEVNIDVVNVFFAQEEQQQLEQGQQQAG